MKIVIEIPDKKYEVLKMLESATIGLRLGVVEKAIINGTPLPQCKDCKHFETDVVATCDGIPLIIGHEVCTKWGDGCKTKEDGYCFMFEAKGVGDGSD